MRNFKNPDTSKTGNAPKYVEAGTLSNDKRVNFDKILFIKRRPYISSHYYSSFIDGVHNWNRKVKQEGGALCVLDLKTKKIVDLVPQFNDGTFQNLRLSFDAKKVLFSYKKAGLRTRYLLYEVGIDGKNLRRRKQNLRYRSLLRPRRHCHILLHTRK